MNTFRTRLAQRLLRAAMLTTLGCGGVVEVDEATDSASTGSTGGTAQGSKACAFSLEVDSVAECPPRSAPPEEVLWNQCYGELPLSAVTDGPELSADGYCCYTVHYPSCDIGGRPYVRAGALVAASGASTSAWVDAAIRPRLDGLTPAERRALSGQWLDDALIEHASVASFGRFALELMAVGAPAELLADAHRAALDEIAHARMCFALASAYAAEALGPAAFPFHGQAEVRGDLAAIAAAVVREGCIGETLAAAHAAEQLARATDPAVRRVLAQIAEDESRHAELAWRTVAWALRTGDERVRQAVRDAFAPADTAAEAAVGDVEADAGAAMRAHGRLDIGVQRAVRRDAWREVIDPCVQALLA